jgi:hypothetical protein
MPIQNENVGFNNISKLYRNEGGRENSISTVAKKMLT